MKILRFTLLILASVFLTAQFFCAGRSVQPEKHTAVTQDEDVRYFVKKIEALNAGSPGKITAGFVVDGRLSGNKKFKTMGNMIFSGADSKMKVSFLDSVFKSTMTVAYHENDMIKFYLPVEKKLYIDNASTIQLKNYLDVNIDYGIIKSLAIGRIPLLLDYRIKQGVTRSGSREKGDEEYFLILENSRFFETISIKNDIPNRLMFINKATSEKMEFYLERPMQHNDGVFFRRIRFVSVQSGERITVDFNSIDLDPRIQPEKDFTITVPKNTEILRIR